MATVTAGADTATALARSHTAAARTSAHTLALPKSDCATRGLGNIGFRQSAQGKCGVNNQAGDVGDIHAVCQWAGDYGTNYLRNWSRRRGID